MSAIPKPRISEADYLEQERRAEFRSEFFDGELFAMAGASFEHTAIADNLVRHFGNQLSGTPCRALSRDMRVKVSATGLYTYPDVLIVCGEPRFIDGRRDTLLNPRVVVEVLSESTEAYDRGKKFDHYRQVESIQEYLLVSQDRVRLERYQRRDDGVWPVDLFEGPAGEIALTSVPVRVRLADIYEGVWD